MLHIYYGGLLFFLMLQQRFGGGRFFLLLLIPREERSGREGGVSVRNVTSSRYKHSGGCMCEAGIDQRDQKERRLWVLGTLGTEMWVPARRTEITRLTEALFVCFFYIREDAWHTSCIAGGGFVLLY